MDQRTGADRILRDSLDEPIPGGARFAYVFGSALLFIFVSQMVTGLCLALYYVPAPMTAHVSVAYIVKEVAAGSFLRSLHSYGSSAMVVVLLLHFVQTLLYGSYKGKRELLWISGCILSLLVMGMAFTGYLLPWDQKAYFAGSVGTDIVGQVPVIGESLRLLLRGGATMGALTISRFYVLHVFVIPALIFALIATHIALFRKAGAAGPINEDPVKPHLPVELFYPGQVLIDMAFVLVVMGVLGMLAHFVPVTLGPEANPTDSRYLPRPEWYFLPMFQWLKYWEGWRTVIGVVMIPVALISLVFLLPFMDRGLERRPWRRPIPVGGVFMVLFGLLWLGMSSHLADSRDPAVAAQIAQQTQQEDVYFHAAFQPYSASSLSGEGASTPLDATAAHGKALFDAHGCSKCHGESGKGAEGPALTHISSQYPPIQLTALLKTPTAKMTTAGMIPLTVNAADMTALVSYLTSLGGASAPSVATPPASGASPPAVAKAKPGATAGPSTAGVGTVAVSVSADHKRPAKAMPGGTIYQVEGCASCHGAGGIGTSKAPALAKLSATMTPAALTGVLQHPTDTMTAGGMPPVKATGTDLSALVAYLKSLATPTTASAAASAPSPGASASELLPVATTGQRNVPASQIPPTPPIAAVKPSQPPSPPQTAASQAGPNQGSANPSDQHGETIFKTEGCASCHGAGGVGTSKAPALTKLSTTMTPAALTGVLQHPTDTMQAGGMPPVKATGADLGALVAYLQGLATPVTAQAPAPATAPATAPAPATTPLPGASPSSVSPATSHQVAKVASQPAMNNSEAKGKVMFEAHGCADCHGPAGVGGTAAAAALAGTDASLAPALLTTILQHPTARMQQGGMPPVSLSGDELKALVAYVSRISGAKSNPQ
jgi:ubiquinol-cytochrome c reductase cytochrome b subunit